MRKIMVLVVTLLFMFTNVSAITINDASNCLNNATISTNDFLNKLNNWVVNNKDAVIYLLNEESIIIDESNYEKTIDDYINILNEKGFITASEELSNIKIYLVNDLNSIKNNQEKVYNYLKENEEYGVSGNLDIMHELKTYFRNIDNDTGIFMTSLYNIYYDDISSKINSFNNINEAFDYIKNALKFSLSIMNTYTNDISKWQDLYNSYITSDYENKITNSSIYQKYLERTDKAYTNLYDLVYSNFKDRLDKEVNKIDNESGITAIVHNNKLYDLIDELNDIRNKLVVDFEDLNSFIKINVILDNLIEKEDKIINQIDIEVNLVRNHLWNTTLIEVKEDKDKKYFDIDLSTSLIKFNGGILESKDFVEKLDTDYTKFVFENLYNNNVGTGSKIDVYNNNIKIAEFIIVVAGDVEKDGKISALDYISIRNEIMNTKKISDNFSLLAADCNNDNKISALDYIYIRNYIMNGGI